MNFTLMPHLTALMIGFVLLAGMALVVLLIGTALFFAENRVVRVRRHEGFLTYYGHLAQGY